MNVLYVVRRFSVSVLHGILCCRVNIYSAFGCCSYGYVTNGSVFVCDELPNMPNT